MKKVFIINAAQSFAHSGGRFNDTIARETVSFFEHLGATVKKTDIMNGYNTQEEVDKYVWANVVIYHTPIWWFQLPFGFKKYIDEVFTQGHRRGIYRSDGRKSDNPQINYGTGGSLHGRKYMVTSSWNAPETAFTLPNEFFNQHSVDDGPLFGFHRMNAFTGMDALKSYHFHDVEKNAQIDRDLALYRSHLQTVFGAQL